MNNAMARRDERSPSPVCIFKDVSNKGCDSPKQEIQKKSDASAFFKRALVATLSEHPSSLMLSVGHIHE